MASDQLRQGRPQIGQRFVVIGDRDTGQCNLHPDLSFPQKLSGRPAIELTKLTGTETKLLFERLTKGRMGLVTGSKRNLRNVDGTHAQFSSRAFQAHTTDIVGNVLAYLGCEDAMKVGHRETSDCRQHFPIERFVDVLVDILLDRSDAFAIILRTL